MRLNHRLARLERRAVDGADCASCGFPKDGSRAANVTLIIPAPRLIGEVVEPTDRSNDFCRVCGTRVKLYIPSPREIMTGA